MQHFIFPSDPLNPRAVDEYFAPHRSALEARGFTTSLVPDRVLEGTGTLRGVPSGQEVIYRGWMVTAEQYRHFVTAIEAQNARPLTSLQQYLNTHHLPNWYPLLAEFTPLTRIYPEDHDLVTELQHLRWPGFFIKDYVKSLKTSIGSRITDPSLITRVVSEMRSFRGEIEGGICVRQLEDLLPETELRYFVLNGGILAPVKGLPIPEAVRAAANRVNSSFFSVDVALRKDGVLRIVELGDGQVSDLVGWSLEHFLELWPSKAV